MASNCTEIPHNIKVKKMYWKEKHILRNPKHETKAKQTAAKYKMIMLEIYKKKH